MANEVYLSQDETCRDLFTRESTFVLNILPNKSFQNQSNFEIPNWTQGTWLSIGIYDKTFYINKTQLIIKLNNNRLIQQDLKFLRIIKTKRQYDNTIRIRAKSLEQW